jgi:hypothetical protein
MGSGDYVMTISSDDEEPIQSARAKDEVVQLDMDFIFDPSADGLTETWSNALDLRDFVKTGSRPVHMARFFRFILEAYGRKGTHFR